MRAARLAGTAQAAAAPPEAAMLVGDSVMLGASCAIARSVNVVRVDAAVGRQAAATLDAVRRIACDGATRPTVIVDLGNNGTVDEATLRSMLGLLSTTSSIARIRASPRRRA